MLRKTFCFALLAIVTSPTALLAEERPKPKVKDSKRESTHGSHAGKDNRKGETKKEGKKSKGLKGSEKICGECSNYKKDCTCKK